jgi:2-C-methyl-D-erythritol 4-phosphate cytidylyltransferase
MKNIAIVLAGGKGRRLGYQEPKHFVKVAGKMIIEHTIDVFQKHPRIDEIFVVVNSDYVTLTENLVIRNQFSKVKKVLKGGSERSDSSLAAINAVDREVNLIFHDAVRPLVNARIIDDCIEALAIYNAVDVAMPATDTIIEVKNDFIADIPDRSRLRRGQTPQAFKWSIIKKSYELALKDPDFKTTDDCGVIKKYLPEEKIYIVKGEEFNMKITYEEDLFLADKLFQMKSTVLSKNNISIKKELKDKVVVVFGGSYGIGKDIVLICSKSGAKAYSFSRTQNETDISKVEDVQRALKKVFDSEGKIDFVVNTAGVLDKEPLAHMDYITIREATDINYLGNISIAKESFPYLEKTAGSLLFFTSSSYTRGRAMYSVYSSLKAATVNLVQALSSEWEDFNIRINCINPERTRTPMRVKNFGAEDPGTLLGSYEVAEASIKTMLLPISGLVIDVKKTKE